MLEVTVICIGKLKEKYLRDASAEYQKRLSSLCRLSVVELPAEKLSDNPSQKEIEAALLTEGRRILEKIPERAAVFSMCIEGKELSSEELSKKMFSLASQGFGKIVFVIGGSFGLSPLVKEKSALRLSVSRMTFPHQLFRVMLLEQIYRAFQIENGSKYHK